jgi:hypothetical protein
LVVEEEFDAVKQRLLHEELALGGRVVGVGRSRALGAPYVRHPSRVDYSLSERTD